MLGDPVPWCTPKTDQIGGVGGWEWGGWYSNAYYGFIAFTGYELLEENQQIVTTQMRVKI